MYRVITGATGLIGQRLVSHWLSQNHRILVVGRDASRIKKTFDEKVEAVTWSQLNTELLADAGLVINLAGENIGTKKWSETRKKNIYESRIKTTHKIAALLCELGKKSPPLFNASAIGVYGLQQQLNDRLPQRLDEDTEIDFNIAPDFLSKVGRDWEKSADIAIKSGVRVVFLRFGVVLAKEGGALAKLLLPFKLGLGGPVGTGHQPFSWVTIDDVIAAIDFLISQPSAQGAYNIVAPECVMQRSFAKALGSVMKRPSAIRMPTIVLNTMLGKEMARELLLEGQHVYPKRLNDAGFEFNYPDIGSALLHLLEK